MDQRTNFYEDEDSEPETIYIPTIDQGKEILYDEFIDLRLSGLTQNDEKKCRKKIKETINNQSQTLLTYGVPYEYPITFLTTVIDSLAEEIKLSFKEKRIFYKVTPWFIFLNCFLIFFSFSKHLTGSQSGMEFSGYEIWGMRISEIEFGWGIFTIYVLIYPFVSFWIARLIIKVLSSNLLGIRGILMGMLMGILLTVFFTPKLIKYLEENARFEFPTLEDDNTSVPIPPQSTEENTKAFKITKIALNLSKTSSSTEFIQWVPHAEPSGEYNQKTYG